MTGLGTIVNALAVIVGSTLGLILKFGIPERFKATIMQAISLSVILLEFLEYCREFLKYFQMAR